VHPDAMALVDARDDVDATVVEDALAPRGVVAEAVRGAHGIAVRTARLDAELLGLAPDLRIVSRHGVGCDSVDVDWVSKRGLPVAIAVGGNDHQVAEHALAMMLGLARRLEAQSAATRAADWSRRAEMQARDLEDMTLLIVGHGRIGGRVGQLARAFGMRVIAHDPYVDGVTTGIERVATLADGLARADVVTVHTPRNPETIGLVGAAEVAAMRPGAILINCARGGICDEAAVAEALRAGRLAGYGCDVFAEEPATDANPVLGAPNTILTPHSAAMTPRGMRNMGLISIRNCLDCFDGTLRPEMIFNRRELGR